MSEISKEVTKVTKVYKVSKVAFNLKSFIFSTLSTLNSGSL